MIPASFEYEVAESVDHAVELLGSREDAKLLAGGHSLLPAMRLRIARPGTLVDVGRLRDLRYIREDGDAIAIGALTRHHDLETDPLLKERCGLLAHAAGEVGDPMVRNRGTIGGSVAHADPAADYPAVLMALDAELVFHDGRTVAAADFFRGVFETALGPADMLTEVRVPALDGAGWSFLKFRNRSQDWATVGVAAVTRNGDAAIGLANMGATPLRAKAAEAAYRDGGADAAGEAAAEGTDPPEDTAASAEFRRHLARVLTRRALEEAKS
jgi:carbon-monoxide dehydrogenase medium subunit